MVTIENIISAFEVEGKVAEGKAGSYRICCRVTSSPEGSESRNRFLSGKRAESIRRWLLENAGVLSDEIEVVSFDEAWEELEVLVRESDMPWRDDVLEILCAQGASQGVAQGASQGSALRKAALRRYCGGEVWEWMKLNWFPLLRQSLVVVSTSPVREPICIAPVEVPRPHLITLEEPSLVCIGYRAPAPAQSRELKVLSGRVPMMHLKVNAIGLVMGVANIAAEVDLARHWSVAVPFYYSGGFNYFKSTVKFRGISVQPEVRYYFSDSGSGNSSGNSSGSGTGRLNRGFYAGVHAGVGWYNYALDGEFRIQDHKGRTPAYGGGIGLGYAFNFKKASRWGMEFAVGGGVYKAKYDILYNEDNGPYSEYGVEKLFIGVDNASVAVTYSFNLGKGGR